MLVRQASHSEACQEEFIKRCIQTTWPKLGTRWGPLQEPVAVYLHNVQKQDQPVCLHSDRPALNSSVQRVEKLSQANCAETASSCMHREPINVQPSGSAVLMPSPQYPAPQTMGVQKRMATEHPLDAMNTSPQVVLELLACKCQWSCKLPDCTSFKWVHMHQHMQTPYLLQPSCGAAESRF